MGRGEGDGTVQGEGGGTRQCGGEGGVNGTALG